MSLRLRKLLQSKTSWTSIRSAAFIFVWKNLSVVFPNKVLLPFRVSARSKQWKLTTWKASSLLRNKSLKIYVKSWWKVLFDVAFLPMKRTTAMVFFTFDEPPIYKKALKYIKTWVKRCQISGIPLNLVTEKKLSNAHFKRISLRYFSFTFPYGQMYWTSY